MNRLARYAASAQRRAQRTHPRSAAYTASPCCSIPRLYSSDVTSKPPPASDAEPTPEAESPKKSHKDPSSSSSKYNNLPFPDLMKPEPFFDLKDSAEFPPSKLSAYPSRVVVRNDPSMFLKEREMYPEGRNEGPQRTAGEGEEAEKEDEEEYSPFRQLPMTRRDMDKLHMFPLITRRITQQTGKGKIHRMYTLVVVGNGHGLVGYGEGKDDEIPRAQDKAYLQALRNMDYVDRFEQRTIWTEMSSKMGATQIIIRPRPVGFGLHCNPNIHQVLKAAGVKDISAKVWGSRNPINVIKLLFRMLHAGNAPLAMGDGIGGKGRKLDKGSGVRGRQEIERERGRKLINLTTRAPSSARSSSLDGRPCEDASEL